MLFCFNKSVGSGIVTASSGDHLKQFVNMLVIHNYEEFLLHTIVNSSISSTPYKVQEI